jgi:hypothetical protein
MAARSNSSTNVYGVNYFTAPNEQIALMANGNFTSAQFGILQTRKANAVVEVLVPFAVR